MRRVAVFFFVLLVAWSLVPGGFELAEDVYHLATHGDLAHQSGRSGHPPFNPEHGCGGGFHLCPGHAQPLMTASVSGMAATPLSGRPIPRDGFLHVARGFSSPPEEPPRA